MGKKHIDYRDAKNKNEERDKDWRFDFVGYTRIDVALAAL
jgi:hypothetical protein